MELFYPRDENPIIAGYVDASYLSDLAKAKYKRVIFLAMEIQRSFGSKQNILRSNNYFIKSS